MAEEKKQEQQIVEEIVEEEYIEDPHRWTFLKYVKSIARFKFWIIGFSLAGALAGYLGFRFILNPMNKKLSATYTYDLAGVYTDADTIRFIDGTLFNPYDLTSKENLKAVKDSDAKYTNVNIDKIASDGAIVITKNVSYYNDNDTENTSINYSISANTKYFPNDNIGKDYIYDLINLAKDLSTKAINNYNTSSYFTENFSVINFEKEIAQLQTQYNTNNDVYSSLIDRFGSSVIANNDGAKLYELRNDYIASYYTFSVQSFTAELQSELKNNKYVNYVEGQENVAIDNIRVQCENYIQEIRDNNRKIAVYQDTYNRLITATTDYRDDIAKEIASLAERITEYKLQIDALESELENNGYYLDRDPASPTYGEYIFDDADNDSTIYKLSHLTAEWVNGCKTYKTKIDNYRNQLENDRQSVTSTYQYCYSLYQNKVNIQNGGYVNIDGKISNILGAGIGFVVGFVITSLITAAIYIYKKEK